MGLPFGSSRCSAPTYVDNIFTSLNGSGNKSEEILDARPPGPGQKGCGYATIVQIRVKKCKPVAHSNQLNLFRFSGLEQGRTVILWLMSTIRYHYFLNSLFENTFIIDANCIQ